MKDNLVEMSVYTRRCSVRCFVQVSILLVFIIAATIFIWPINVVNVVPSKILHVKSFKSVLPEMGSFYRENCFDRLLINSIEGLSKNTFTWSNAYDRKCQILWKKFQLIYRIEQRQGQLSIPSSFYATVYRWLGNNSKLVTSLKKQSLYHIFNHYSREYTVYNPLRSKRPIHTGSNNARRFVNELSDATKADCDFCNYEKRTAEDVFGRVVGKHSASASNAFKLDKWHGLFLTKKHNPLELEEEEFLDWFHTALEWFRRANSVDRDAKFPMMIWDSLPHAGASQFHPHVHGILGAHHYHGSVANQAAAARAYRKDTDSDYWKDLVEIHTALGLAVRLGEAVAIAPLTAVKDHELMLLSGTPCDDLFRLLFRVVATYRELDRFCHSSGMALPVLGAGDPSDHEDGLPAVIRIGTRGQCDSSVNDASSLELFLMYNVNVDPYTVVAKLREVVARDRQRK